MYGKKTPEIYSKKKHILLSDIMFIYQSIEVLISVFYQFTTLTTTNHTGGETKDESKLIIIAFPQEM